MELRLVFTKLNKIITTVAIFLVVGLCYFAKKKFKVWFALFCNLEFQPNILKWLYTIIFQTIIVILGVNHQNAYVKYKLLLCVSRNFFSYDIAVVLFLFIKQALNFW